MTTKRMTSVEAAARRTISRIERIECGQYAADLRRAMRDERFSVLAAIASGDDAAVAAATAEARRVGAGWGVEV